MAFIANYLNTLIIFMLLNFRKCLQVVLEGLISRELLDFMMFWNSHKIRTKSAVECPSGIPIDLYEIPENHGTYTNYNIHSL